VARKKLVKVAIGDVVKATARFDNQDDVVVYGKIVAKNTRETGNKRPQMGKKKPRVTYELSDGSEVTARDVACVLTGK